MIASSAHIDVDEQRMRHDDASKRHTNDHTHSMDGAVTTPSAPATNNKSKSNNSSNDDDDNDDHGSVVAVGSQRHSHDDNNALHSTSSNGDSGGDGGGHKSARRLARERERLERLRGKLTTLTYADFVRARSNNSSGTTMTTTSASSSSSCSSAQRRAASLEFIRRGQLLCVMGSRSQFDARVGRLRDVMPPLTIDCCQTFATLSAVLLSSLCFDAMVTHVCCTSTVNYLLYIAAWTHQLTVTSWPQRGVRPTVGDLNTCLRLRRFFPSKVHEDEFEVVFYSQASKAEELLRRMCALVTDAQTTPATPTTHKRPREDTTATMSHALPTCGYVIVSGDYTVSVYAVAQAPCAHATTTTTAQAEGASDNVDRGSVAASSSSSLGLYICDSHGTQPWSRGKASVCGLCIDSAHLDAGVRDFATVLFTLLEEHRSSGGGGGAGASATGGAAVVPYMTWTPLRRRPALVLDAEELKRVLDEQWLPCVLADEVVRGEARRFGFAPLECFWGMHTP